MARRNRSEKKAETQGFNNSVTLLRYAPLAAFSSFAVDR